MNKKLLHQSAQNLILKENFTEMEDMLNDYQDFLTQDENQAPLESNPKNISISFTTVVNVITIIVLVVPIVLSFVVVETSLNTRIQLFIQIIIGAITPLVAYFIYYKKVKLLSKFYEPKKNENVTAMLLCIVPVMIVVMNTIAKFIFVKYDWYHTLNFYNLTDNIAIVLVFAFIVYSLKKLLKTSQIYFSLFYISNFSMVVIAQIRAINSTLSSVEEYYVLYKYVVILLVIGVTLSLVLSPKQLKKEV